MCSFRATRYVRVVNESALPPGDAADAILALVAGSLPPMPGVVVSDHNESLLVATYGRMYRCLTSIRDLAGSPRYEADDARVLTRALLSATLRSLWLVAPDDPVERERRQRSAALAYFIEQRKIAVEERAAGVDVGDAPERLQRNIDAMQAAGVTEPLNEHDIAVKLNMKPFYTRVYRVGSDTTHYSIGAALDGFGELTSELGIGPVPLERPNQNEADHVLVTALIVYGQFLQSCEPVIKHGLTERVTELVAAQGSTG